MTGKDSLQRLGLNKKKTYPPFFSIDFKDKGKSLMLFKHFQGKNQNYITNIKMYFFLFAYNVMDVTLSLF